MYRLYSEGNGSCINVLFGICYHHFSEAVVGNPLGRWPADSVCFCVYGIYEKLWITWWVMIRALLGSAGTLWKRWRNSFILILLIYPLLTYSTIMSACLCHVLRLGDLDESHSFSVLKKLIIWLLSAVSSCLINQGHPIHLVEYGWGLRQVVLTIHFRYPLVSAIWLWFLFLPSRCYFLPSLFLPENSCLPYCLAKTLWLFRIIMA